MRTTLKEVNAALRAKGYDAELVRGLGYYYFTDPFLWEQGVYGVGNLSAFSPAKWVEIYENKIKQTDERRGTI